MSLAVIDIGVGNTASMVWALERLGASPVLTSDPSRAAEAERLVFPGVGAAAHAMERLEQLGLDRMLKTFSRPLLGVCLGMQMFFDGSEEGAARGLGLLPGQVTRIEPSHDRPSPHMGWNRLIVGNPPDPLLDGVEDGAHAYFVHGYAVDVGVNTIATTDYGRAFSAMVRKGNVWGCQFHPERSGPTGARILSNFLVARC